VCVRSGTLKGKMSDGKEKNSRNLKENVMKMIYVEMLGQVCALSLLSARPPASPPLARSLAHLVCMQNADFGHMEAVRLVNRPDQKSILLKRIGYLAASLVLHDQDQVCTLSLSLSLSLSVFLGLSHSRSHTAGSSAARHPACKHHAQGPRLQQRA